MILPLIFCVVVLIYFSQKLHAPAMGSHYLLTIAGALCLFFMGASRYHQQTVAFDAFYHQVGYGKWIGQGTVIDTEKNYKKDGSTLLSVDLEKFTRAPGEKYSGEFTRKPSARAQLMLPAEQTEHVHVGDRITVGPLFFRYPYNASYRTYLIKEKTMGSLWLPHSTITKSDAPVPIYLRIHRFFVELRNNSLASLEQKMSRRTYTFFTSVFLGKHAVNSEEMDDIRDHFRPWGILHYLARSGLHLLLIIIIWHWILKAVPLPFILRSLSVASILILYILLSWSSISFIRAAVTYFLYSLCTLNNWPIHTLYLFFLTAFLVLLTNPLQLFFLDFQLSFSLTLVLCWLQALRKIERHNNPLH